MLSAIPLPLRIAGLLLAGLLLFKAVGAVAGSVFLALAIVLWLVVISTVMYELGWLNALSRVPGVSAFLGFMSNRAALSTVDARSEGSAPQGALSDEERAALFTSARTTLSELVGGEDAAAAIHERIVAPATEDPESPFATRAPAILAVYSGPPGVGKTTAAISTARMLAGCGALATAKIVTLRGSDLRSGQYGGPTELGTRLAEDAVDGTLMIDDADWLLQPDQYGAADPPGVDVGTAILDVAQRYPGRIFLAATLGTQAAARIASDANHRKWYGKLAVRNIPFRDLTVEELADITLQHLRDAGWRLEDGADRALEKLMKERRDRAGGSFDNAEACRRIAEQLIETAKAERGPQASRIDREIIRIVDEEVE